MTAALDVAAALLRHPQTGQVLLTQRPAHKLRGGLWECPGGKIETGESAATALARELREELGIDAEIGALRFIVTHAYSDLRVRLHVHEVASWRGALQPLDVADLCWVDPLAMLKAGGLPLAAADRQILQRLLLPRVYRITPDCPDLRSASRDAWLDQVRPFLQSPDSRVLFRVPSLPAQDRRDLLRQLLAQSEQKPGQLLVSRDIALAQEFGLGLHLSAAQLGNPPEGWDAVVGARAASTHDEAELRAAAAIGCDWTTLSPVQGTASHPGSPMLGWPVFQRLSEDVPIAVYALGGVAPAMLGMALLHGAVGVAGISRFWDRPA